MDPNVSFKEAKSLIYCFFVFVISMYVDHKRSSTMVTLTPRYFAVEHSLDSSSLCRIYFFFTFL